MRYTKIFRQSYTLTLHNPLLWLFGLVLLGGFNLSLVNFSALLTGTQWNTWPVPLHDILAADEQAIALTVISFAAVFLILNLIKVGFIIIGHNLIHEHNQHHADECRLCTHLKNKTTPYSTWWTRVILSSLITLVITGLLSVLVNSLLIPSGSIGAMIVNLLFLVIVACGIGTWNTFTAYFIVIYDLDFQRAASAAFDLLVIHARRVFEFIILLSAIYTVAVIVSNAFISGWQHGFARGGEGIIDTSRFVFLAAFVIWFALNNAFFNLSFLLFFDEVVKSRTVKDPVPLPQLP